MTGFMFIYFLINEFLEASFFNSFILVMLSYAVFSYGFLYLAANMEFPCVNFAYRLGAI